jgi:hypothetical protein
MAIGYANFATIQNGNQLINQGNQQVVNSMANLGNQIGQTIETYAATESAKTMLPMLQQQYSTGMEKIANGEQGGMADVIQAASLASQNPITAGIGSNMIAGMQQASHMANTQAYLQGTRLSSMATHPEMYNPDGTLNTSRLGQAAPAKPYTPYQQEQSDRNAATDRNAQLDAYSQLYSGNGDKEIGISGYADKIIKAIKEGNNVSQEDFQNFAQRYKYYKQKQSNYGKNAINNEGIDRAYDSIIDLLTTTKSDLHTHIKRLQKNGEDPTKVPVPSKWFKDFWPDRKDLPSIKNGIDETLKNFQGIHNMGKKSSSAQNLIEAVEAAKKHPDKIDVIKKRLQDAGIDPALFDQAMKSQQTQQQSPPQASNKIPAANQVAPTEDTQTATPEEED